MHIHGWPSVYVTTDNPHFKQMVGQIYPTEPQLNKANSSNNEVPFLSITNGIVSSKI